MASSIVNVTINFSAKTLTISEGTDIVSTQELIFKIVDPLGTTVYKNTGYDTQDFANPDIEAGTGNALVVDMPLDTNGEIIQGTYSLQYYSRVGVGVYKVTKAVATIIYCVDIPVVTIEVESDCLTSTLDSVDATEYELTCSCGSGTTVAATTVTYNYHTIIYPATLETPITDQTTTTDTNSLAPNIWTGLYVSRISAYAVFNMPLPAYTGAISYFIEGTLTGVQTHTVLCDDCICQMFTCIHQILTNYLNLIGVDPSKAATYEHWLIKLNAFYMLYALAQRCGNEDEMRTICGEIKRIINDSGCVCCSDTNSNEYSTEVIPVIGSGASTITGTSWYDGVGLPAPTLGNNGDYYINTTDKYVYKKVTGAWVYQFAMTVTALVSNQLLASDNTSVNTHADTYTELKSIEFDVTQVQDGSVLQLSANLGFYEPTGEDTAIRVNFVGVATDSTTISVNADYDGNMFPMTLELEYYVMDVLGTLTIVGKMYRLFSTAGVVDYNYSAMSVNLQATLTPNEINLLAKSDDNITEIYLNHIRLNHLRTA